MVSDCPCSLFPVDILSAGNQKKGQQPVRKNNGVGTIVLMMSPFLPSATQQQLLSPQPLPPPLQRGEKTHIIT